MKTKKKIHRHKWDESGEACFSCGYYTAMCKICRSIGYFTVKGKLEYIEK